MKKLLNLLLLISFLVTILVPITGIPLHKLASTLFLVLCIVHTALYRKRLGTKRWLLLGLVFLCFATGLFGMILDAYPIVLTLHRVLSMGLVFFLAIHIFIFHKRLKFLANRP